MGFLSTARSRVRCGVWAVALLGFLTPANSYAQTTYTWNQSSGGDWMTAANWGPGGGPPNAASNVAAFGGTATGASAVTLASGVMVGELKFEDVTINSLTAAYTIGSSAQTITFDNGGTPSLLTVGGFTTTNQTIAANISIAGGQPLTITNNGAPGLTTLTISGGISASPSGAAFVVGGSSNTVISGAIGGSVNTLTKNGPGVLTLSAANNYTGGTVINGGTVRITNNNQLGATGLGNGVTLNGGALQFGGVTNLARNITLGASGGTILTTAGNGATNPTVGGVISGGGPLTVDGGFYLDLTQNNTYTGATIVNNAGLRLAGGGQLSATSSVTVNGYVAGQIGLLTLDNSGGGANRVNDTTPITLNGGLIAGVATFGLGNNSESLGALTLRGFGTINGTKVFGGIGSDEMIFSSITRTDDFSTLYVGGPVFGPASGSTYQVKFTSGLTNPGGSGQTIGIIPWIGGDRGAVALDASIAPTNNAVTLYTFNTTDGLVALDPAGANFNQVAAGGSLNGIVPGAKNNAITNSPAAVNSSITILSLVQNPNSSESTISGTGTLTVSTGAIVSSKSILFDGPALNFGGVTGYVWLSAPMVIGGNSRITGSNGLVVSSNSADGQNELYMTNTTNANTFSGGLYLNGTARVVFTASDAQLGAAGEKISFRGGTLQYLGTDSISLATSGTPRPLELSASGGGIILVQNPGTALTVPGAINGSEMLTVLGSGILSLTNASNTYAGGTAIGNATLAVAGPGSLGTGNVTFGVTLPSDAFSGGTLRFDGAGTYAANINQAFGAATLNTGANNVTLSGIVSGNGTTLTKTGTGTLTLAGANTYTANTTVSAGTLLVTNASGSGTGYGSVTVNSGATIGGTGAVAGPVTVNGTGKLIAGTPGATGTLTLRGKTTLAGTSTFQAHLAGTTAGTGYAQLVVTPGGSIDLGGAALLATLGYGPTNADKLFIINNQNATGGLVGTFASGTTYTFGDGTTASISYTGDFTSGALTGGNDVVLYGFQPVPEPTTVLGLATLALGGLAWHRRKTAVVG